MKKEVEVIHDMIENYTSIRSTLRVVALTFAYQNNMHIDLGDGKTHQGNDLEELLEDDEKEAYIEIKDRLVLASLPVTTEPTVCVQTTLTDAQGSRYLFEPLVIIAASNDRKVRNLYDRYLAAKHTLAVSYPAETKRVEDALRV